MFGVWSAVLTMLTFLAGCKITAFALLALQAFVIYTAR